MNEKEKGCVYFLKHRNFNPIKIGYSSKETPSERFEQFKTYAPFGGEMLGFILSDDAQKLEKKIHEKYKDKRLLGEWFDIDVTDVDREIILNSTDEENHKRSEFYLKYLKTKNKKELMEDTYFDENIVLFLKTIEFNIKIERVLLKNNFLKEYPNNTYTSFKFNSDLKRYCKINSITVREIKFNGIINFIFNK